MRTTLLSDAHLRGLDDPNQADLVAWLRQWPTDELVLVGDLFDTWWGWPRAVFAAYVPVLAALWEIRRAGTPVVWVPGNHDFHAGPVIERDLGITVRPRWRRVVGGKRILALHGDEADTSRGQRALTRLLRGPVARGAMRALGPGAGWAVAERLSRHSRMAGGPGLERLLDRQRALADGLLGPEADVVLVGHSHAPGIEERPDGRLVNLGDWLDHRTFAVIEDDVILMQWDGRAARPLDEPSGMRRRAVAGSA